MSSWQNPDLLELLMKLTSNDLKMCLERFLSASFAGSSVSLNFRNWRQRTCRSETGWRDVSPASSPLLFLDLKPSVHSPQSPRSWWGTSSPRRRGCGVWSTAAASWPARNTPANAAPAPEAQTHTDNQVRFNSSQSLSPLSAAKYMKWRWGRWGRGGLTLALTPSWTSGTRGMTSYMEETYVMMDFSSGWGTSTSVEREHS